MSVTPEQESLALYRWMNVMTDVELDDALDSDHANDTATSCGVASRMALNLAVDAADWWKYFSDKSLSGAYKAYLELRQLSAHDRERDLLERTGADGRVKT